MKQITVISGKGGTGKTSLTAALSTIIRNKVIADCDVDAPDLHLLLNPKIKKTMVFHGLKLAERDVEKCIRCMKCYENCRFDAINEVSPVSIPVFILKTVHEEDFVSLYRDIIYPYPLPFQVRFECYPEVGHKILGICYHIMIV